MYEVPGQKTSATLYHRTNRAVNLSVVGSGLQVDEFEVVGADRDDVAVVQCLALNLFGIDPNAILASHVLDDRAAVVGGNNSGMDATDEFAVDLNLVPP